MFTFLYFGSVSRIGVKFYCRITILHSSIFLEYIYLNLEIKFDRDCRLILRVVFLQTGTPVLVCVTGIFTLYLIVAFPSSCIVSG